MTTFASSVMEHATPAKPRRSPGLLFLLSSSVLVFLFPRVSRAWTHASVLRAAVVAFFNTLCGFVWAALVLLAAYVWVAPRLIPPQRESLGHVAVLQNAALALRAALAQEWAHTSLIDRFSVYLGLVLFIVGAYLLPYFVILPFGARPGPNKPCVRHVARTVLLGSGVVHWWGAAYVAIFIVNAVPGAPSDLLNNYVGVVTPLLLAFTILSFWTLAILILAVRQEYRGPADFPETHDPWCDDCGYILTGVDPGGRCPECGRLIADSIGPDNRPPTAWERRPSFRNLSVVAAQLLAIVRRPRALFFSMPTLTGQPAAQRWLLATTLVLFLLALPIVPALYVALQAQWNFALVAGALAMALAWAVFGLMMVGVETAGIATFSRLRGQRVYLATSAKVTAYSALLMIPWIFLGGAQLVAYSYLSSLRPNGVQHLFHVGLHGEQVVLAVSLSLAHIGGLLWYELTVYRGIRAIQYANK